VRLAVRLDALDGRGYVDALDSEEATMRRRRHVDPEGAACRAPAGSESPAPWAQVLAMQRTAGNRAVARLLSERRAEDRSPDRTSRRLQRQLVAGLDGRYTDTRDVGQPPIAFVKEGNNYRETTSGTVLSYTATHQLVSNGSYFDPYTREWYQPQADGWYSLGQQWYWYDGTYYQPHVQQPAAASAPQASSPSFQTTAQRGSQTTAVASPSAPASSRPGGQMSNDDFRRMLFGGSGGSAGTAQAGLSQQLGAATSLQAAIELLRSWPNPAEALALVRSSSHARGFKGLRQRLGDRQTFAGTERGHRHAEYVTYRLYIELLQRAGAAPEDAELEPTCRRLGFDKPPDQDPDGGGNVGHGGATKAPKQRLVF
jgi:hypothetical protein